MKRLYNVVCMLACMIPMLSFVIASVVLAAYGHPYFSAVFAMFSILTVPKMQLGPDNENKDNNHEQTKQRQ